MSNPQYYNRFLVDHKRPYHISEIALRFHNKDTGEDIMVPLTDLLDLGVPIDDNGDDMDLTDENVYYQSNCASHPYPGTDK
jgi:hypothetical protein